MEVTINIGEQGNLDIEAIRRMNSELEILTEVEIQHNEGIKKLLNDPRVVERKIYVNPQVFARNPVSFSYAVEDFALTDADEKALISVGYGKYASEDLRERHPYHQWSDTRPAV